MSGSLLITVWTIGMSLFLMRGNQNISLVRISSDRADINTDMHHTRTLRIPCHARIFDTVGSNLLSLSSITNGDGFTCSLSANSLIFEIGKEEKNENQLAHC